MRFHHHGIAVADLAASVEWYRTRLDFRVEQRFTLEDAALEIVKLVSPDGVRIELLSALHGAHAAVDRSPLVAPGKQHLCFAVSDVAATIELLRARGVRITQEAKVILASNEMNGWFADQEGNLIELIQDLGPGTAASRPSP